MSYNQKTTSSENDFVAGFYHFGHSEFSVNGPQDARLRHQVVQERCNVLAVNLAEEQAEFNAKQFQAVTGLIWKLTW